MSYLPHPSEKKSFPINTKDAPETGNALLCQIVILYKDALRPLLAYRKFFIRTLRVLF